MRDSFLTIGYKTGWIHTCYDRELKKEIVKIQVNGKTQEVKSVHAAKINISKSV